MSGNFAFPAYVEVVENTMLNTLSSTSLLTIMEIIAPIVLAAAMIYASVQWSRRRRARLAVSEAATRGVYRSADRQERMDKPAATARAGAPRAADEVPSNPKLRGQLRSGREQGRQSEDDIAREHLGDASKPKLLDERETQINKHLDPGHTA
jgi:hypothetical protein